MEQITNQRCECLQQQHKIIFCNKINICKNNEFEKQYHTLGCWKKLQLPLEAGGTSKCTCHKHN